MDDVQVFRVLFVRIRVDGWTTFAVLSYTGTYDLRMSRRDNAF
jgi:hypothetical protein